LPDIAPVIALVTTLCCAPVRFANSGIPPKIELAAPFTPPTAAPLTAASKGLSPFSNAVPAEIAAFWKELVRVFVTASDSPRSLINEAPSFMKSMPGICEAAKEIAAPLMASSRSLPLKTCIAN
jgi:hypothetical protein